VLWAPTISVMLPAAGPWVVIARTHPLGGGGFRLRPNPFPSRAMYLPVGLSVHSRKYPLPKSWAWDCSVDIVGCFDMAARSIVSPAKERGYGTLTCKRKMTDECAGRVIISFLTYLRFEADGPCAVSRTVIPFHPLSYRRLTRPCSPPLQQ